MITALMAPARPELQQGSISFMTEKTEKPRISGKEATQVAMEAEKYGPVRICATDDSTPNTNEPPEKRKFRRR